MHAAGCDGMANSGLELDSCGTCGGHDSHCVVRTCFTCITVTKVLACWYKRTNTDG